MKILYSHRTKSADGQYVHIRALSEALAARGHELFMAGPDDWGGATRALDAEPGGAGLRALMPRALGELAELAYSLRAEARLAGAAGAFAPDLLYERYNLFHHAGANLARKRALPFILEINAPLAEERARHGGLALKGLARRSERAIWRAADIALPVTGALAARVAAAGVDPARIHVIQNGVEPAFLGAADPGPVRARYGLAGRLVLGFSGFVRAWHGVDRVLRFMAAHRAAHRAASGRDDLFLLLVGDGDARPGLERLARDLGLADRFAVTGVVQREEMPAHVAAFDIALQPAVVDYASPLKLFEYMALGKAIAAPASANILEVLDDGETALLFAPDQDEGLFRALAALAGDAALRGRLGAAARARLIERDYTWAGNAARVEALATTLLGGARP